MWGFYLVLIVLLLGANTSWAADFTIIHADDFTDNRAAGEISGTVSSSGLVRTVADSEENISIFGDKLLFSGGKIFPNWEDPIISYPECQRIVNEPFFWQINLGEINDKELEFGLSSGPLASVHICHSFYIQYGNIIVVNDNRLYYNVGIIQSGVDYCFCIAIKAAGAQFFIKGGEFTDWTKLFESSDGNQATYYPYIANLNAVFSCDFFRHSSALDNFSNVWIIGPNLINDPSLEANYTNGACDSLLSYSNPTLAQSADTSAGCKAQQFTGTMEYSNIYFPAVQAVAGKWYRARVQGKRIAGTTEAVYPEIYVAGRDYRYSPPITSSTYQQYEMYVHAQATGDLYWVPATQIGVDGFDTVLVDECELCELTENLSASLQDTLNRLSRRKIFSAPVWLSPLLME